jgi:hypothetical protein
MGANLVNPPPRSCEGRSPVLAKKRPRSGLVTCLGLGSGLRRSTMLPLIGLIAFKLAPIEGAALASAKASVAQHFNQSQIITLAYTIAQLNAWNR